jgi:hypothetical protein
MADNYLEFSEVIPNLTEPEEAWLKEQLQAVSVFDGREYVEDAVPTELTNTEPDWSGIHFLRDKTDYDPDCDMLGFDYAFHEDHDPQGWGRHLWLYAEECGNPDNVAWLVRKFLKQFRPKQCWSLTYAITCSKPRIGEFGGGAVFVTADEIKWQDAHDFVEQERTAIEAMKNPALQTEEHP